MYCVGKIKKIYFVINFSIISASLFHKKNLLEGPGTGDSDVPEVAEVVAHNDDGGEDPQPGPSVSEAAEVVVVQPNDDDGQEPQPGPSGISSCVAQTDVQKYALTVILSKKNRQLHKISLLN